MKLKLEKLDGRHSGLRRFKYRVWVQGPIDERITNFIELRDWCWQVWGPSCERDIYRFSAKNPWAWHSDNVSHKEVYIYLTDDAALSFFKLKWM